LIDLYGRQNNKDQPPLIVIPGAFGSRLLDTRTQQELWPGRTTKLLLSSYKGLEVDIDEDSLEPVAGRIRPYEVFEKGLGRDFYGQVLLTLERAGGYRRVRPGQEVRQEQKNYFVYLYDWRLDNVAAVQGLHELVEDIRARYGDPRLKVDILAHSNGGMLARYFARYGTRDHLDTGVAVPDYAGARMIRRLMLVGTPNLGSIQPVLSHIRGEEIGFRKIPAEIVATTTGAPQLMPHPAIHWLVDTHGDPVDRDAFDIETWREFEWSIFSRHVRERTIRRKGGGATGRRYLSILEQYLAKHLVRGKHFLQLMTQGGSEQDVKPYVFGGDCAATVARLILEESRGRYFAREKAEAVSMPVSGINYHQLIHDPGDTVVTRASLLGNCSSGCGPTREKLERVPVSHSVFLCEEHQRLTSNPSFQDNLLHTLFDPNEA